MVRIIMTAAELVNKLKALESRKSYYKAAYPYNLLLNNPPKSQRNFYSFNGIYCINYNPYDVDAVSGDCVNLYKALLNGYNIDNHNVGYYQKDLSNTGDCDEWGLMSQCTDVSTNFSKLKNGEPRLLYMSGHIGGFIGEFSKYGKTYNVCECTAAWGRCILFSYVDANGNRFKSKGGEAKGRWTHNGLMTKWIDYTVKSEIENGLDHSVDPDILTPNKPKRKTYDEIADEVIAGKWGTMPNRKKNLEAAGYDYNKVQPLVNTKMKMYTQSGIKYYTVKKGDNLTKIAKENSTTVAKLKSMNNLKDSLIYPNQKLRVR